MFSPISPRQMVYPVLQYIPRDEYSSHCHSTQVALQYWFLNVSRCYHRRISAEQFKCQICLCWCVSFDHGGCFNTWSEELCRLPVKKPTARMPKHCIARADQGPEMGGSGRMHRRDLKTVNLAALNSHSLSGRQARIRHALLQSLVLYWALWVLCK